jgi:tetratricopeptide (TPR) repeat protein
MKSIFLTTTVVLTMLGVAPLTQAENLEHVSQLLATKQCSQCDLSGTGLVMANLSGANLSGANLSGANLSQANLSQANLSGASLNGANLSGANLSGANLNGTDLRRAYLINTNLKGAKLDTAYVEGTIGIPNYAGTPEQFYSWGLVEMRRGNFTAAIEFYNKALTSDSSFAPAYLARGIAYYRLDNEQKATEDAQIASQLFDGQKNFSGHEASQNFLKGMELARKAELEEQEGQKGGGGIGGVIQGVLPFLLQFLF